MAVIAVDVDTAVAKPGFLARTKTDILAVIALGAMAAALSAVGFHLIGTALCSDRSLSLWYGSDSARILANLTQVDSAQWRSSVHPLFTLLLSPIVRALGHLGLGLFMAAKLVIIASAALFTGLFYALMRQLTLSRPMAVLYTGVVLSSAAFIDWFTIIENKPVGAVTILLALMALASRKPHGNWFWIGVNFATLSMTTTNWMAGMGACLVRKGLVRALLLAFAAFGLAAGLAIVQQKIYPHSNIFFEPQALALEPAFLQAAPGIDGQYPWTPEADLRSEYVYSVVAPLPHKDMRGDDHLLTDQDVSIQSGGWVEIVASIAWIGAFLLGAWGLVRSKEHRAFAIGLGLILAGQTVLHLLYGNITSLYVAHFLPLVVVVAAFGAFTRARALSIALCLVVIVLGGTGNLRHFKDMAVMADEMRDTNTRSIIFAIGEPLPYEATQP